LSSWAPADGCIPPNRPHTAGGDENNIPSIVDHLKGKRHFVAIIIAQTFIRIAVDKPEFAIGQGRLFKYKACKSHNETE